MSDIFVDKDIFRYKCPHCDLWTEVPEKDLNCKIFRHGVYKSNFHPINPHASQEEIARIKDTILGCGGPHQIYCEDGKWKVKPCSWSL
jgi:hypothetical protein